MYSRSLSLASRKSLPPRARVGYGEDVIDPTSVPGYIIETVDGEHLGTNDSTILPLPGDHVRVEYRGDPRSKPYQVVRREFVGNEIYVIVRDPSEHESDLPGQPD
jgi:hypothetical protein